MHERALEAPLLEQLRHQIDRVALADAAEIDLHAARRRADHERRRRRARATAAPCRSRRRTRRRSGRTCAARSRGTRASTALTRVLSPAARWLIRRDVAVRQEAAQLALEAIDEVEGRLRRLRRVPAVGVHGVDLEHRGHRLVREAPDVARARAAPSIPTPPSTSAWRATVWFMRKAQARLGLGPRLQPSVRRTHAGLSARAAPHVSPSSDQPCR